MKRLRMSPLLLPAAHVLLVAALAAPAAQAHITLAQPQAMAGSYARITLQVPHGCQGSATTALTVTVPPGLLAAKPMPKAGWTLTLTRQALQPPVTLHGRALTETVSQVRWSGGPLASEHFDEFVLHGKLAEQPGRLPFVVTQTCEQGEVQWSGPAGSPTPAPVLEVTPAAAPGAHGAH